MIKDAEEELKDAHAKLMNSETPPEDDDIQGFNIPEISMGITLKHNIGEQHREH